MPKRIQHDAQDRLNTDNVAGYHPLTDCPDFDEADRRAGHIAGDPFGESNILVAIQDAAYDRAGVLPVARAMSFFGEHALGWIGIGMVGAAIDNKRARCWLGVSGVAFTAHAASVVLKRVVRRLRPHDERIRVGVSTPSKLSFPSSHATSTTAALLAMSSLTGSTTLVAGIPLMMFSRMVLGVHYPTDVIAGAAIGAATVSAAKKLGCPAR